MPMTHEEMLREAQRLADMFLRAAASNYVDAKTGNLLIHKDHVSGAANLLDYLATYGLVGEVLRKK